MVACLDAIYVDNEMQRDAIKAAFLAHTCLHPLLSLFGMLYIKKTGELLLYGHNGVGYKAYPSCRGARRGCVLGTLILCLTISPIYAAKCRTRENDRTILKLSDDAYLMIKPDKAAQSVTTATPLFVMVGIRIRWGHGNSELATPTKLQP